VIIAPNITPIANTENILNPIDIHMSDWEYKRSEEFISNINMLACLKACKA